MTNSATAPDYVATHLGPPDPNGPSQCLADGSWCGHGEPLFRIFDARDRAIDTFAIHLPAKLGEDELRPNAVKLAPDGGNEPFLLYDPRKH